MNLIENYLTENGYDYFGNAAEDTLVFFVRDNDAPLAETISNQDDDMITKASDNITDDQETEQKSVHCKD